VLDGLLAKPLYGTHMYVAVQEQVRFRELTVLADVEGSSNVHFFTSQLNRMTTYK
jgi:hypothetical protein